MSALYRDALGSSCRECLVCLCSQLEGFLLLQGTRIAYGDLRAFRFLNNAFELPVDCGFMLSWIFSRRFLAITCS